MSRRTNRQRISKPKPDPSIKAALSIGFPISQVVNDRFVECDVVNHTEDDHRAMVRALGANMINQDARTTIRRKTKIEKLRDAGIISVKEALACEWYKSAHALRYDTTGVTMRYGSAGGGGCTNFDHLPKSREQEEAYKHFTYAREGINPFFLPMFERIVLYGRPLGKLGISFRTAARELLARIEDKVAL
jgi:hypothetical protein